MPRKISNGTALAKAMLTKPFLALPPTERLVYVGLLATTRRPFVDRSPFLVSNLATLTGLSPRTVAGALAVLEKRDLLVRSQRQYSDAYYLPEGMLFDRLSAQNANHRRAVQKRLSKLREHAADLCDQFLEDHPAWRPKPYTLTVETTYGVEPTARRSTTGD